MTAQWHDSFIYKDEDWDLVGIKGEGFFNPLEYGLNPVGMCTACWRGFICKYKISDKKFILDKLDINHGIEKNGELDVVDGPVVNGVSPEIPSEDFELFRSTYNNLNINIKFSGGVIIAKDFIEELYVHMGFHPAWKYGNVIEIIFKDGVVTSIRDVSEAISKLREKMKSKPLRPDTKASQKEIHKWIEEVFEMQYYDLDE